MHPHVLKMIDIAEVQVALQALGFEPEVRFAKSGILNLDCYTLWQPLEAKYCSIEVRFTFDYCYLSQLAERVRYDVPNWQDVVLRKVKELIHN